MYAEMLQWLPPGGIQIILVLFLSFLIGLEREEHKASTEQYAFGGVRSFPLIGLIGYSMALLSGPELALLGLGFAVVAAFLVLSYWHKLSSTSTAGITSELSGLTTYVVGALVYHEQYWIATAISVASLLLLELKAQLENLAQRMAPREIFTFTQFLLITAVILPMLPNRDFGPFHLNPYKAWLVVVAVSAVSYGSYVCTRVSKGRGGILLTAILGGAYSSTVTTVSLAKHAERDSRPNLLSGAILMASGVMYLRLLLLIGVFNHALFGILAPWFLVLSACGLGVGWVWAHRPDPENGNPVAEAAPRNPLEPVSALIFSAVFVATMTATGFVVSYAGAHGVLTLAAVMGVTDVDPFILGMTQTAGSTTPLSLAAMSVVVATASNNLVKGLYSYGWADRATGRRSLVLLAGLSLLGLLPLAWI